MPTNDEKHKERLNTELRKVGLTDRGIKKFYARSVDGLIHPEEHILGAIYGRYGEGSFNWYEGMLIGTDRRLLFIDLTPGVTDFTEVSFDLVSAIKHRTAGPFTAVTLFTGVQNYDLRFVNTHSASILVHYVEKRRLEQPVKIEPHRYEMQEDQQEKRG